MSDDFSPIRAKQVPLSHAAPETPAGTGSNAHRLTWGLVLALCGALLVGVFYLLPAWLAANGGMNPAVSAGPDRVAPDPATSPAVAGKTTTDPALPPFQQVQREQARTKAQAELATFVERQIELEDKMHVGAWGAAEYDAAKAHAAAGDERFVREQFDEAIASYQAATAALDALIQRGGLVLEDALERGNAAIQARDPERADAAFELAATIAPEDPRVHQGKARAALLPRINTLMREGRNQELTESWDAAFATYQQIQDLDPDTQGLEAALQRVTEGRRLTRVQTLLSEGFAHLEAGRSDQSRASFREVLSLDPGNPVAAGGVEQVVKRADVSRIQALREQADAAVEAEHWEEAADLYARVLQVDPVIRFAQAGLEQAELQQRTNAVLGRILQNPEKLSSDKLYQEARQILERAEGLEPRGPRLTGQIADVRAILDTYANPVAVVLRSDNRTEITVSSVGALGSFEEKRLELRPGAYTVIGSRDGCRDVREQIVVRPNMNPVDIRCAETL